MIEGAVNAYREAVVELAMRGPEGQEQWVAFVVDTGFDGALTLPRATTAALGLRRLGAGRALLADGRETLFDVYQAIVLWGAAPRRVLVDVAETTPLLGMGLLEGHELSIKAVPGGRVRLTPLPDIGP